MGVLSKYRASKQKEKIVVPKHIQPLTMEEYWETDRWKALKQERFEMDNYECVLCAKPAQVAHHRRYPKVLGTETANDLVSLCNRCHHNYHNPVGLREAKADLEIGRVEGVNCPVCNQYAKEWKRGIVATAAADLCKLVCLHEGEPVHINEFTKQRSNFYCLAYWDLIASEDADGEAKRGSGMWSPTEKGILFVKGKIAVPKYSITFNNKVLRLEGEMITIHDALGNRFNYEELMRDNYG
jgi:hypothetical protein